MQALVKQETDAVLDMQKRHVSIEHEIRLCTTSTDTVCMWKNLPSTPAWLHSDVMLSLESAKAYMIKLVEEKVAVLHTEQSSVPFTSIRALEYDLIKSGELCGDIHLLLCQLHVHLGA